MTICFGVGGGRWEAAAIPPAEATVRVEHVELLLTIVNEVKDMSFQRPIIGSSWTDLIEWKIDF